MKKRERRYKRMTLFTKASIPVNAVMALAKFVLAAVSLNFFLLVNGLYNVGMCLAKFVALKGHYAVQPLLPSAQEREKQVSPSAAARKPLPRKRESNRPVSHSAAADPLPQAAVDVWSHFGVFVGAVVTLSSLLYMLYCVRMFVIGSDVVYNNVIAIAIAAFTFGEIGLSIRGIVVTRRDREPMIEAVKLTNLASALISLVLTQTALLSFTSGLDMSFYNGIAGMVFGSAAALIGSYIIIRFARLLKA